MFPVEAGVALWKLLSQSSHLSAGARLQHEADFHVFDIGNPIKVKTENISFMLK